MAWAVVTFSGLKTPSVFVEDGVKIKQFFSINMLNDKFVPWMNALILNIGLTLQQDGTTAHTAKTIQSLFKMNLVDFWLKEMWLIFSLVLNLSEFRVFSKLEQKTFTASHPSVEPLKKKLTESCESIFGPTLYIRNVICTVQKTLNCSLSMQITVASLNYSNHPSHA